MNIKKLRTGRYQLRWRDKDGKQRARNFRTKELAQDGLRALHRGETNARPTEEKTLRDVIAQWKTVRYSAIGRGTQEHYDKLLRLYFDPLLDLRISELSPAKVDDWIAWMKSDVDRYKKANQRTSFNHELVMLKTVLGFYEDYCDDDSFKMPIKKRHRIAAKLRNRAVVKPKDLSEADFFAFRQLLEKRYGVEIAALATLQYYDALRISEAVPLEWGDVRFNFEEPRLSRLVFSRHVIFARSAKAPPEVEPGLKNSEDGKEHPMLPEVFAMLRRLWRPKAKGLVFPSAAGGLFTYRQVQYRYNSAFEALGLPYSSTHVMRHAGTRKTFDETGGDEGIAAQQLGNTASVKVYAKRSVHAFTNYAASQWDAAESASARNVNAQAIGLKTVNDSE